MFLGRTTTTLHVRLAMRPITVLTAIVEITHNQIFVMFDGKLEDLFPGHLLNKTVQGIGIIRSTAKESDWCFFHDFS